MKKILVLLLWCCSWAVANQSPTSAAAISPSSAAETVRSSLNTAQTELIFDQQNASGLVQTAQTAYQNGLAELGTADFASLKKASQNNDQRRFAILSAQLWTGILRGAYQKLEQSLLKNDLQTAKRWLLVREYRRTTRNNLPETEATLALERNETSQARLVSIRADLLGTYQARLSEALGDLEVNLKNNFLTLAAQNAALATGYFSILEPMYPKASLAAAKAAFLGLTAAPSPPTLAAVQTVLRGWRAAPLSERERNKRAAQVMRFLPLISVEYARGVKTQNGITQVSRDLEISEATAFWNGANNAFSDLESLLVQKDSLAASAARSQLSNIGQQLRLAAQQKPVALSDLQNEIGALVTRLETIIPAEWRVSNSESDLEVIREHFSQLETAVKQGAWEQAETARISAYAILESGVEARIRFFQPQLSSEIEMLFWQGSNPTGLAKLVNQRGSLEDFRTTRRALVTKIEEAARFVGTDTSPAAAFVNALVIIFREGLEAVLILAALLGSLKRPEVRHLRRPLWLGAATALFASGLTFIDRKSVV